LASFSLGIAGQRTVADHAHNSGCSQGEPPPALHRVRLKAGGGRPREEDTGSTAPAGRQQLDQPLFRCPKRRVLISSRACRRRASDKLSCQYRPSHRSPHPAGADASLEEPDQMSSV